MASTGNECVTDKQFKVWASKQGGGSGGGSKAVTLWESDGVHISPGSVEASNEYKWIVIWLGASLDTTSPIAVAWGTNNVYAIPQMDRSVRGAIIAYSGTRLTISTQMGVVASKVQVANWE